MSPAPRSCSSRNARTRSRTSSGRPRRRSTSSLDDVVGGPGHTRHRAILWRDATPAVPDAPWRGVLLPARRETGSPRRRRPERHGPCAGLGHEGSPRRRALRPRAVERTPPDGRDCRDRGSEPRGGGVVRPARAAGRTPSRDPGRTAGGGVRPRVPRHRPARQALPRRGDDRRALRSRAPGCRPAVRRRQLGHGSRRPPRRSQPRDPVPCADRRAHVPRPLRAGAGLRERARRRRRLARGRDRAGGQRRGARLPAHLQSPHDDGGVLGRVSGRRGVRPVGCDPWRVCVGSDPRV